MLLRQHLFQRNFVKIFSRRFTIADPILPVAPHQLPNFTSKDEFLKSYRVTPPIKPWPSRLSQKRLVSMISRQQNLDLALQIFHHAGKFHPGFFHNYNTYHAMIEKLARARVFEPMESLLSELHRSGVRCGENLFVAVIRNYGFANRPKLALKTFLRIKEFGVETSVRSFNCLLNALIQTKEYNIVHTLFKNCRKRFGIIPNVFTCNILIKALCKKRDTGAAFQLLDEMPSMGMVPNVVTYTTILGGLCANGDLVGARNIFDEILDRGWIPDPTTYTILMDGYFKHGRLVDAIKVMDEMENMGVAPNDVTYGVAIEAYCKAKKGGEALNLLNDMLENNFIPSSGLACRVIDLLCQEEKVDDACHIWKKLLKKNCTPDNAISGTLIYWLCKVGKVWEARKLFNEFVRGSIPNALTYNTLIAGMCENGELQEAGKLWDDMVEKGCEPNEFTFNMLIKGFLKKGMTGEALNILPEMLEKCCAPNKLTYTMLIDGLCESGMKDKVMHVLQIATSSEVVFIDKDCWGVFVKHVVGTSDGWMVVFDGLLEEVG
ncbi:pentatricopeptide repeat-containing protein At5g16420, mitochondrial [Aristolochia californica]|uniref:pentatricopeptide repeat-containing protein At5g16420, mitochondrial n=1 Tax=Aristolochia californica TaxID=171875 RepID=UPI0035D763D6